MSLSTNATQIQYLNAAHSLPFVARVAVTIAVMVTKWDARQRSRKHLTRLEPHLLRDIGIDPISAQREGQKPFWQD
ncbi:DUF1127 domain-containing protein [Octadecabacter sp. CECT 8868]|uniref:DUF1127 domain-containing protein n=1 Tax=Octadecabacter algicola TaxID=2909342 RepID=UPI001F3444D3|nr:DUF1127 domain-containing protein [Octadecabacter algicola]MCF2903909.1 DUF1127 domain-containing protein [Octadecabacter algicola]